MSSIDELLALGQSVRGELILKLAQGEAVSVTILEYGKAEAMPDRSNPDRAWISKELNKVNSRLEDDQEPFETLPTFYLRIKTLEPTLNSNGGLIPVGTELRFERPFNNMIWDYYHKVAKDKVIPFNCQIVRQTDEFGTYLVTNLPSQS